LDRVVDWTRLRSKRSLGGGLQLRRDGEQLQGRTQCGPGSTL